MKVALSSALLACGAAFGSCGFATRASAADCLRPVGRLPGEPYAVAVSGDHGYLAGVAGLVVADLADVAAPRVVGEVGTPLRAWAVAVSARHAYVAYGFENEGGLLVVDISIPSSPVEVGVAETHGPAIGVTVRGGYAYVAAGGAGLRVIDVSTPSTPVEVGFVDTPGFASGVAVGGGGHAFVADGVDGLRVIDVSNPTAPVEVGFVDTPSGAVGVAVTSGFAYVADEEGGVRVIDVRVPWAPVEVAAVDTGDRASGVAVSGGYAFVAVGTAGLLVIEVSIPPSPVVVGLVDTPGIANAVAVAAGHAYVADRAGGLRVIDVGTPAAPVEVGSLDTAGEVWDLAASSGFAYVVGEGLHVIDVSTPSAPVEVGFVDLDPMGHASPGGAIAVSGGHAYVLKNGWLWGALNVIDVRTPSAPVKVAEFHGVGIVPRDIAVSGAYAYVVDDGDGGLHVIDVSVPSAPVAVGFLGLPDQNLGITVVDGYAYVTARYAGLRVVDVSSPSAPVEVGFLDTSAPATAVAASGRHAYVGFLTPGFGVVDISDPSAPVEVGFVETPGPAGGFAVTGDTAYLAWHDWESKQSGVRAIDVTVPFAPIEAGSYDAPGDASGVAVSDGHVLLTAGPAGLFALTGCEEAWSPDGRELHIPAAALAAGAQGAFFTTDVEINNTGTETAQVVVQWLPRGEDNSEPVESEPITLAAGHSLRYENVLTEVFGLAPNSVGALKLMASNETVIGMSRTYNTPGGRTAGTFGQGLPAIRATEMIQGAETRRIIFLSETDGFRANVGCVNGTGAALRIDIELFDDEGTFLEAKNMDLGPYSNNQINRIFEDYAPVNGYVDVSADSDDALYFCYGSLLDNSTSDPTTILPQAPSAVTVSIPAAALAAGLENAFFETDVELNNVGSTNLKYHLIWLPRGVDNSDPEVSDFFWLAPGAGVRYANVLEEVFGLARDQIGAVDIEASEPDLLAMSRTYTLPSAKVAGTFGQGLPGIPADRMIPSGQKRRIVFMSESDDIRSNVGCINRVGTEVAVQIELYDSDGGTLDTRYMLLPPYSNRQINGIFQDYAPVNGFVDVRTDTPEASIYCYGSVLDNQTNDPTTVLPQ